VTWGVFPGHEIAQSTIIGRENFLSWKVSGSAYQKSASADLLQDEAFYIWLEWAQVYPPGSEERQLLEGIRRNRWLISVIHHDYKNPEGLWTFLLDK
jgi:methylenetetrahydrofolate reductase (NADPH)